MRNVITTDDLMHYQFGVLFKNAEHLRHRFDPDNAKFYDHPCDWLEGKVLATLFMEPSTRTRLSFESAFLRLGGKVISVPEPSGCSCEKGEKLTDTIRTVVEYCDLMVVRSSQPYVNWLDGASPCKIINAGDGEWNHPTQALLDAYTIWRERRGNIGEPIIGDLKIGISGDLEKSRTIRSFVETMCKKQTNQFILYDSTGCDCKLKLRNVSAWLTHCRSQEEFVSFLPDFDVLYMNRIQSERRVASPRSPSFCLNSDHVGKMKPTAMILNPGPRRDEISDVVANMPQCKMWDQVRNGLYARMALMLKMLGYD